MLSVGYYVVEPAESLVAALRDDCFSVLLHKQLWSIQEHDRGPLSADDMREQVAIAHLGQFRRVYASILDEHRRAGHEPIPMEDFTLGRFEQYFKIDYLGPSQEVEEVLSEIGPVEIETIAGTQVDNAQDPTGSNRIR
jgi:hypothetical protein